MFASDLFLAALPLPIGLLYLYFYTSSLFLAVVGAVQLAIGWPLGLFLYRYIFRFNHVEELTLLAAPTTAMFSLDAMALLIDSWQVMRW